MIKVYKCNSPEDYHKLLDMYPGSCWSGGDLEDCEKNDIDNSIYPLAILVNADENPTLIDYSSIESATWYVHANSNSYAFVEFPELLNPIDVLRTFLKHHNVYDDFKQLAQESSVCKPYRNTTARNAIDECGFSWTNTPYLSSFWNNLEEKWYMLCNHFSIGNKVIGKYHKELFSKD